MGKTGCRVLPDFTSSWCFFVFRSSHPILGRCQPSGAPEAVQERLQRYEREVLPRLGLIDINEDLIESHLKIIDVAGVTVILYNHI